MSRSVVNGEFLELLAKSELLSEKQLAVAVRKLELERCETAKEAAKRLVRAGVLTKFQAERLLHGRYRGFFIGGYKLLDLLGSGGMGYVFVAEDLAAGNRVALKVLNDAARDDTGLLTRFQLEARAGARLNHPEIVRTYKVDQTSHVAYVVMDFVPGINLHELTVLYGARPWPQVCDFVAQAARGLQHAHEQGVVHRDVKPSNLLVTNDGRVRILDFGLALLDGQDTEDEFSLAMIFGHDCLGTADYMPPEQARDSHSVDARADVYSLGCTLYYGLTGSLPFTAESNAAKLEAHRTREVPDVRRAVPDVPEAVTAVLAKMTARDPRQRYATAAEVADALEPCAKRMPVAFDFEEVVRIRANDARRRMSRERRARRRGGRSSVLAETGSTMSGAALSSGHLEGMARKSTVVAQETDAVRKPPDSGDVFDGSSIVVSSAARASMEAGDEFESAFDLVPLAGGEPVPLLRRANVLGRGADCEIRIDVRGVSSRHCALEYVSNCWRVRDLDSKNGVRVNGRPVKQQLVFHGDRITVGNVAAFRLRNRELPESRHRRRSLWLTITGAAIAAAAGLGWWWFAL